LLLQRLDVSHNYSKAVPWTESVSRMFQGLMLQTPCGLMLTT